MNCNSYSIGGAARKESADKLAADFAIQDRKLDARAAKRKRKKPPIPFPILRIRNIEKFMADLYGSILPEDDDGAMVDLSILIATVEVAGKPSINFMRKWVPWMPRDAMERFIAGVDIQLAFLNADDLAKRMGISFAIKERLAPLRTIGAYDVPKAERAKIYEARKAAARKARAAQKKQAALKPREAALIKMIEGGIGMGDLARKAVRSKLFSGIDNVPSEVRRVVKRLVDRGILGQRLEPRDRGGKEYFLWAKAAETAERQPLLKNAPRQIPVFIGSNRGADSRPRTLKIYGKIYSGAVGECGEVSEHAPFARAAGRYQPAAPETGMEQRA